MFLIGLNLYKIKYCIDSLYLNIFIIYIIEISLVLNFGKWFGKDVGLYCSIWDIFKLKLFNYFFVLKN